jgi:hypothetical protein
MRIAKNRNAWNGRTDLLHKQGFDAKTQRLIFANTKLALRENCAASSFILLPGNYSSRQEANSQPRKSLEISVHLRRVLNFQIPWLLRDF